jgi:hypothetical protein
VTAITDNPNWNSTVALITLLNATYLLPDSTGPGTLLLPTNQAFRNLRKCLPCLKQIQGCRRMCTVAHRSTALHDQGPNAALHCFKGPDVCQMIGWHVLCGACASPGC